MCVYPRPDQVWPLPLKTRHTVLGLFKGGTNSETSSGRKGEVAGKLAGPWCCLTVSRHAHGETLLEAALLAAVTIDADDGAVLIFQTPFVLDVLLDAPTEKALGSRAASEHPGPGQAYVSRGRGSPAPALPSSLPHLATLAGVHTVVEAGGHVPTHLTQQHHAIQLCRKRGEAGRRGLLSGRRAGGVLGWKLGEGEALSRNFSI